MGMGQQEAEALARAGIAALREGRAPEARRLLEQLAASESPLPAPWFLLAQACHHSGDRNAADTALDRALAAQPRNLGALIMKGDYRRSDGDLRASVVFYTAALKSAQAGAEVPPVLAGELRRIAALVEESGAQFGRQLNDHLAESGIDPAAQSPRFRLALDILEGRKEIYLQQPSSFYFPGLPQIAFYERSYFPWLAEIETAAPAIRAELEALLAGDGAFEPYVRGDPTRLRPANPLFEDPSWSACHLLERGEPTAFAARCPETMRALAMAPIPRIAGRSPMALFSLLRPGTHIRPHHGLINTRLICHLPLIVPGGCRIRVGSEVRSWEQGETLIFDDSFEHEAWNEGDGTRVVLLFEIWRPEITPEEQRALVAMFEAIGAFQGVPQEH
jgi:hypothetical protein